MASTDAGSSKGRCRTVSTEVDLRHTGATPGPECIGRRAARCRRPTETSRAPIGGPSMPEHSEHVEYLRGYLRQLRKKLEADPDHPEIPTTEPGIGYRFMAEG